MPKFGYFSIFLDNFKFFLQLNIIRRTVRCPSTDGSLVKRSDVLCKLLPSVFRCFFFFAESPPSTDKKHSTNSSLPSLFFTV